MCIYGVIAGYLCSCYRILLEFLKNGSFSAPKVLLVMCNESILHFVLTEKADCVTDLYKLAVSDPIAAMLCLYLSCGKSTFKK